MERVNHRNALKEFYVSAYANFTSGIGMASPQWPQFASKITSPTESNVYTHSSIVGPMREWLGKRHVERVSTREYRLKNRLWEKTIGVKKEEIDDDLSGTRAPDFQFLGMAVATHPDDLVFDVLNNGHTSAAVTYDDVPFFSNAHPGSLGDPDAPTQSNISAAGGQTPWYLAKLDLPLKPLIYQVREEPTFVARTSPDSDNVYLNREYEFGVECRDVAGYGFWQLMYRSTLALNQDNLWAAYIAMSTLKSEEGFDLNITPTHLIVPVTLLPTAKELLAPTSNPQGYNSTANLVQLISSSKLATS